MGLYINMVKKLGGSDAPSISVVIVDSRSHTHPEWVQKAIDSVKGQTLDDIELIVLDNKDRLFTIGRMYNQGLQNATADWVYFLGDDDYVSCDYFATLKVFIERYINEDTVIASTYSTFFDDDKKEKALKTKCPMGAYKREYFLEHPFHEYLIKYIDVNAVEEAGKDGKNMATCPWHFGYYYRQHSDNISSRKIVGKKE